MHGNVRPHTARICTAYIYEQGIEVMDWPSRSPTLIPRTSVGHPLIGVFKVGNLLHMLFSPSWSDTLWLRKSRPYHRTILYAWSGVCQPDAETVLTLGAAISATDLTRNSIILFERAKVMIAIALIHLCFTGDSPLIYVQNKVWLKFVLFYLNCLIKQHKSTKHDYNLEGFYPIFAPLNILSSVFSPCLGRWSSKLLVEYITHDLTSGSPDCVLFITR